MYHLLSAFQIEKLDTILCFNNLVVMFEGIAPILHIRIH